MFIIHIALGGCFTAPPVEYGITADTGGHIAYILDAAMSQADALGIGRVEIVTRLFADRRLPSSCALPFERLGPKLAIRRMETSRRGYLAKEALAAEIPAITDAIRAHLRGLPRLPDAIHAHFADAAGIALAMRDEFGIPVVYTPHALGLDKGRCGARSKALTARIAAERVAIAGADAIVVSTRNEAAEQVASYGIADAAARTRVIAPGIPRRDGRRDREGAASDLGRWLADPGKPILLAVARPVAKKNLVGLARAYAASPALREAANLVILAGQASPMRNGEEREVASALATIAASDQCIGRIALPPRHGPGDVGALYRRASRGGAFVNVAHHEPFGLTLIEAAEAGVPVVSTGKGGAGEIVSETGHGLLVDPADGAAIAASCLRLVTDRALHARLAAAGRRNASRYSWSGYATATAEMYRGLKPRPRLLACDIDDTLTGCRDGADAFGRWLADRPLPFVVATGRAFADARRVMADWNLPEPDAVICDVGTRIMLPGDGRDGWTECPVYSGRLDQGWSREKVRAALAPLGVEAQPRITEGPHKLSFFGDATDASDIRAALADAGLQARVVFSHDRLIDVLPSGGGKAAAVAAFAERHGMTLAECVAAGNSGNDADMLSACGRAIVVGNAERELADLPERPGLHRARAPFAAGVLEGLAVFGLAPSDELPS